MKLIENTPKQRLLIHGAIGIVLSVLVALIVHLDSDLSKVLDSSYNLDAFAEAFPLLFLLLGVLVLPILEELIFRSWLRPKFYMLACVPAVLAAFYVDAYFGIFVFVTSIFVSFRFQSRLKDFISNRPISLLWLSSILFGAIHLTNFDVPIIISFVVLPFFIGAGLILGVVRLWGGLGLSMAVHILYNFIVIFPSMPPLYPEVTFSEHLTLVKRGFVNNSEALNSLHDKQLICQDCNAHTAVASLVRNRLDCKTLRERENNVNNWRYDLYISKSLDTSYTSSKWVEKEIFELFDATVTKGTEIMNVANVRILPDSPMQFKTDRTNLMRVTDFAETRMVGLNSFKNKMEASGEVDIQCSGDCDIPTIFVFSSKDSWLDNLLTNERLGSIEFQTTQELREVCTLSFSTKVSN